MAIPITNPFAVLIVFLLFFCGLVVVPAMNSKRLRVTPLKIAAVATAIGICI